MAFYAGINVPDINPFSTTSPSQYSSDSLSNMGSTFTPTQQTTDRAPKYNTQDSIQLKEWVKKIFFEQNPSDQNISAHSKEYEKFRNYLSAKGNYKPNPVFINEVFELITSYKFNIEELQTKETLIFLRSQWLRSMSK